MKQIFTLLLLPLLVACTGKEETNSDYITDYYPKIYEAELHYFQEDYQKAFELYSEAFDSCEPRNTPLHYEMNKYAEICAILRKDELALEFIQKGIDQGNEIAWIQRDPVFERILNSENGKKMISGYEGNRTKYLAGIDLELRKELQRMMDLDRKHNMTPTKDSMFGENDKRLAGIFEEYGYPNEEVIGGYNIDKIASDPGVLLLHTSDSIRLDYFIPKMEKFVRDGEAPPLVLGTMYDNLELYNGNPQTHGTYEGANMISSISEVNENRLNIGLPTLEMTEKLNNLRMQ